MENFEIQRPHLEAPARYFPLEKGVYEVAPGLRTLGTSFGNGVVDTKIFQIDHQFQKYRDNKIQCRSERLSKYVCFERYSPEINQAVISFVVNRLVAEYPQLFEIDSSSSGELALNCVLTQERLEFDSRYNLKRSLSFASEAKPLNPSYSCAFDAVFSQIQEDAAVLTRSVDRSSDWLSALHLCSASHWSPEEKIGKNFFSVHQPIPGIEKINRAAESFVDAMISKGPYVRFVWSFATDSRLNHHPSPPPGVSPIEWKGRTFNRNRDGSPFILRLERQVTYGLPEVHSSLFTIRVYFIEGSEIRANPKEKELLKSALLSMSPASLEYKGVARDLDEVIRWLDESN